MTPKQEQAAVYIGQGKTYTEAADLAGVQRMTVFRWLKQPEFEAAVQAEAQRIRDAIRAEGIANKQNRIDAYNDRWLKMQQVIAERANDPTMQAVPGGRTGLVVRSYKQVGGGRDAQLVEEYTVDTGTLAELRATEKQAAQELQQWVDKQEHSGEIGTRIYEVDLTDGRSVALPPESSPP